MRKPAGDTENSEAVSTGRSALVGSATPPSAHRAPRKETGQSQPWEGREPEPAQCGSLQSQDLARRPLSPFLLPRGCALSTRPVSCAGNGFSIAFLSVLTQSGSPAGPDNDGPPHSVSEQD